MKISTGIIAAVATSYSFTNGFLSPQPKTYFPFPLKTSSPIKNAKTASSISMARDFFGGYDGYGNDSYNERGVWSRDVGRRTQQQRNYYQDQQRQRQAQRYRNQGQGYYGNNGRRSWAGGFFDKFRSGSRQDNMYNRYGYNGGGYQDYYQGPPLTAPELTPMTNGNMNGVFITDDNRNINYMYNRNRNDMYNRNRYTNNMYNRNRNRYNGSRYYRNGNGNNMYSRNGSNDYRNTNYNDMGSTDTASDGYGNINNDYSDYNMNYMNNSYRNRNYGNNRYGNRNYMNNRNRNSNYGYNRNRSSNYGYNRNRNSNYMYNRNRNSDYMYNRNRNSNYMYNRNRNRSYMNDDYYQGYDQTVPELTPLEIEREGQKVPANW